MQDYDVIIVGAGITGTSLLYMLSRYTDIRRILLLEKYADMATLNTNSRNNAQTLHFGDIETNYSVQKAEKTKRAAQTLLNYMQRMPKPDRQRIYKKCQKMVLAVGEEEAEIVQKNYHSGLKRLFPELRKLDAKQIAKLEPNVMKARDPSQHVLALYSPNGYMVDFGALAKHFYKQAHKSKGSKLIDHRFNTRVTQITKSTDCYQLTTKNKVYNARFVVFAAGSYSLYFAKQMGYDTNMSVISVGGNFYHTRRVLRGKVYRVQKGGIPFAAVHGDPDINKPNINRFGPTVTFPIQLERRRNDTTLDYLRTFKFDAGTAESLINVMLHKDIERIFMRNTVYGIPAIGKYAFLKYEARTIVPTLRYSDLRLAKDEGGIRPQIIDEKTKSLVVGEAKLSKEALIFNMTPSPGATSCLSSAIQDATYITKMLGKRFDDTEFLGR